MTYKTNWSRFVMRYAIVLIGVSVLIYVVRLFLNHDLNSSGATVAPIILTAMLEGRDYVRAEGEAPKGAAAWQQSLMFGLVGIAVTMGFSAFFMAAIGGPLGALLTPVGFATLTMMTGLMTVIFILGARLFFHMGARNELKLQERNRE